MDKTERTILGGCKQIGDTRPVAIIGLLDSKKPRDYFVSSNSLSRMELHTVAEHAPCRRAQIVACVDLLRRLGVFIGIWQRLFIRQPIGTGFLDRHRRRLSDTWHRVGAGNGHDGGNAHNRFSSGDRQGSVKESTNEGLTGALRINRSLQRPSAVTLRFVIELALGAVPIVVKEIQRFIRACNDLCASVSGLHFYRGPIDLNHDVSPLNADKLPNHRSCSKGRR